LRGVCTNDENAYPVVTGGVLPPWIVKLSRIAVAPDPSFDPNGNFNCDDCVGIPDFNVFRRCFGGPGCP